MEDNWCDWCGKSRRSGAIIDWYISEDLGGEVAFCRKHAKEMGLSRNDLISM